MLMMWSRILHCSLSFAWHAIRFSTWNISKLQRGHLLLNGHVVHINGWRLDIHIEVDCDENHDNPNLKVLMRR